MRAANGGRGTVKHTADDAADGAAHHTTSDTKDDAKDDAKDDTMDRQTNRTDDTAPMRTCADLRAALSAYLDDELTRSERLGVDAQLVGCPPCRDLVERAERLDASLRERFAADFAEAADLLATETDIADDTTAVASPTARTDALVARTEASVLAAIGHARRRTWLPRLAAAAAVAILAAGAYLAWRPTSAATPLAPAPVGTFASATAPRPSPARPAATADAVALPTDGARLLASLTPDERQALYNTSVILGTVARTDFADAARRNELRETVRYDELVDRLAEVLPKLPPPARATVALARDAAARVADDDGDPADWARLREDVDANRLRRAVDVLSMLE